MPAQEPVAPPADVYVHQRWLPADKVKWAQDSDAVMLEYGAVDGTQVYDKDYKARWQGQKLIRYMVELRLHERWELVLRINRVDNGYKWSIQHVRSKEHAHKNTLRGSAGAA